MDSEFRTRKPLAPNRMPGEGARDDVFRRRRLSQAAKVSLTRGLAEPVSTTGFPTDRLTSAYRSKASRHLTCMHSIGSRCVLTSHLPRVAME